MLRPSWQGKIDNSKGLYYSNSKNIKNKDIKNTIDNNIENTTLHSNNFGYIDKNIPYYNENKEYLENNTDNQYNVNANYFNLLDRIGYISKYLLKGNDYYRLYISKNSNKYFSHNDDTNIQENTTNTNPLYNKSIPIFTYQNIEKNNINERDISDLELLDKEVYL